MLEAHRSQGGWGHRRKGDVATSQGASWLPPAASTHAAPISTHPTPTTAGTAAAAAAVAAAIATGAAAASAC